MSQLGMILQESIRRDREARTILGLLREQMEGVDRVGVRRRSLKERLGFKRIGCCGAAWGFRPTPIGVSHDEEEQERLDESNPVQIQINSNPDSEEPTLSTSSGMNLAAALAAERQFRAGDDSHGGNGDGAATESRITGTPLRVSLMRLLEETDGGEGDSATPLTGSEKGSTGYDLVCCVCMVRKKGAAFIPCGHTYCRVCSRELWLNRGSCPLCNQLILEILDIF